MSDGIENEQSSGNLGEIGSFVDSIIQEQPPEATSALLEGIFSFFQGKEILTVEQLGELGSCVESFRQYEKNYSDLSAEAIRIARGPLRAHVGTYTKLKRRLDETLETLNRIDTNRIRASKILREVKVEPGRQYSSVELQQAVSKALADYEAKRNDEERKKINELIDGHGAELERQKEMYESQLKGRDEMIDGLYERLKEMEEQEEPVLPSRTRAPNYEAEPAPEPEPAPAAEEEPAVEPEHEAEPDEPQPDYFSDIRDLFDAKSPEEKERDGLDYLRLAQEARTDHQYEAALVYALAAERHIPDNLRVNAELSFLYLTTGKEEDLEKVLDHAWKILGTIPMDEEEPSEEHEIVSAIAEKNIFTAFRKKGTFNNLPDEVKKWGGAELPEGVESYALDGVEN